MTKEQAMDFLSLGGRLSRRMVAFSLGVSPQRLSYVLKHGKRIPTNWQIEIERLSGGTLKAEL